MVKPKIFLYFTFASTMILTGCKKESEQPFVNDKNYTVSIESIDYAKGTLELIASTKEVPTQPISLKVGNQIIEEDGIDAPKAIIRYEAIGINSDNSNNAADYLYLNQQKLGKIPSNGEKGVTIEENQLINGQNSMMVTIGRYWSTTEYNESLNHGNKWQSCDDFQLRDFHIVLPNQKKLYPTTIRRYYPIQVGIPANLNNTQIVDSPYDPNELFWIGDGWGSYDTYYGHEDPRFNIPFKVEFFFDYQKETYYQFKVDTTLFEDGYYDFQLFEGDRQVYFKKVGIDNTKPTIESSLKPLSIINTDIEKLSTTVRDSLSGVSKQYVQIDGISQTSNGPFPRNLSQGKHTLVIYAKDRAGNEIYQFSEFYASEVGQFKNYKTSADFSQFTSDEPFSLIQYQANPVSISFNQGVKDKTKEALTLPTTTTLKEGIPYHSIHFSAKEGDHLFVRYVGGTAPYERFAIQAKNQTTQQWDTLTFGYGTETKMFELEATPYINQGEVELFIVPDYVSNGSDTMLWVTDTQHYTKFDDLNEMLYKMMEYCAEQYTTGNAGYMIHTGDLVDDNAAGDNPSQAQIDLVTKQWKIADRAHQIVEEVGLPNGVVTGNHDTGSSLQTLDYRFFSAYFGQDRFNNQPWYGGSLNNNASHYDLITIADKDFMIVYLGYGVEGDPDTIAWANEVIGHYPHRNVILATHDYLMYNGGNGITSTSSRYEEIFNQIVIPNENVLMVLCGHDNGAFRREVSIPQSDRKVWEILSDYQFVDSNPDKHVIGSVSGCSGDGYLRLMQFDDSGMSNITYTPYFDQYNPFGADKDQFRIDLNYVENQRMITSEAIEVYTLTSPITYQDQQEYALTYHQKSVVVVYDENQNVNYHIVG